MIAHCITCRFWWPIPYGEQPFPETNGKCRRNAPKGPVTRADDQGWSLFPPMNSSQWCGEHEPLRWGAIAKRIAQVEAIHPTKPSERAA